MSGPLRTVKLVFHNDPGHAWLAVPIELIAELDIRDSITGYSYFDHITSYAYLEEDRDASKFIEAARAAGWELDIREDLTDQDSFVRGLPSYPWAPTDPRHELHGATITRRERP